MSILSIGPSGQNNFSTTLFWSNQICDRPSALTPPSFHKSASQFQNLTLFAPSSLFEHIKLALQQVCSKISSNITALPLFPGYMLWIDMTSNVYFILLFWSRPVGDVICWPQIFVAIAKENWKFLRLLGNRFFSWCRQVYFHWSKTEKLLSRNVQKCFSICLSDLFPGKSLSKYVFPNILNPLQDLLSHQYVWEDRKRANSVIMMTRDANIMMPMM